LKKLSSTLHPEFKLNGLQYQSAEELLNFTEGLINQGDSYEVSMARFIEDWLNFNDTIIVATSGSTGEAKNIELAKTAMVDSAEATGAYFKLGENTKALLCLSCDFIAGKMMLVRAMVLGWDLHVVAPEKDAVTQYDNEYDFVAMVPYQVLYSIDSLAKIKKMIVGGGAISTELEEKLQIVDTEVFSTYGMTETCTHVAVRRVNGLARSNQFSALPNVKFAIDDRGCLIIKAPEILDEDLITNDKVTLNSPTSFIWLGRQDFVINSGGVKIQPEKVEDTIREVIGMPFIIASEEDKELGERVIMIVEKTEGQVEPNYSEAFSKLTLYERPKRVYTFSIFPYTASGKIKRRDVLQALKKHKH
jgi:O-succinylbenzoic acid--CoA ligase